MKTYKKGFKKYLNDLGKSKPSPGGGSAVCLSFCVGVSLLEKAINYSFHSKDKAKNKKLRRSLTALRELRQKIYVYIDKDGYVFEKIMRHKNEKRDKFIQESEAIIIDVSKASLRVFSLAKGIESGIKKSIISDFDIGLELIKTVLLGCVFNLEANSKIFGKRNKYIDKLRVFFTRNF